MNFRNLYDQVVASNPTTPVGFDFLKSAAINGIGWLDEVIVWRLVHNPLTYQAQYFLFDDRSSVHNEEYLVADISFCSGFDEQPDELLFALCKELMHVFDPRETWIDTKEKFVKFLKDLQNTPFDVANATLHTEHRAKWMALLVLCPKPFRDQMVVDIASGALKSELAERYGLPEWLIENALDDYYDQALQILTT